MNIRIYIVRSCLVLSGLLKSSKAKPSFVYALALLLSISSNTSFADRFDAQSLKLQLHQFDSRLDGNIFNVDFLLAHVINNSRKIVRETGEITGTFEDLIQNTVIYTSGYGTDSTAAGSVIIPPGTTAGTIIIINQNEGDSIAIQR